MQIYKINFTNHQDLGKIREVFSIFCCLFISLLIFLVSGRVKSSFLGDNYTAVLPRKIKMTIFVSNLKISTI